MDPDQRTRRLKLNHSSTILHFDYDCFYASVFEAENPALKALPLAVQQKQIVVTCNYEARRRGLYKLQLIKEAKKICPDVIIVLGEDLTRFRNASKDLYAFLRRFSWDDKVERLGFDEVFLDVSGIVDYNVGLLNRNDLRNSFFCLSESDPTVGFAFDATTVAGNAYSLGPADGEHGHQSSSPPPVEEALLMRLRVGSHLAQHMRHALEHEKGYTATVGISTSKLLAKLVGSANKPRAQTTLLPPYVPASLPHAASCVTAFVDAHEIGRIPGIGFKLARKIRDHVRGRSSNAAAAAAAAAAADNDDDGGGGFVTYGSNEPRDRVTVHAARSHPGMGPELLERILAGPGAPHGIGAKVWCLLHGVDASAVGQATDIPKQISIEDSYRQLDTLDEVHKALRLLARSLIDRMRLDLVLDDDDGGGGHGSSSSSGAKRWLAFPKTLRLSTRPRGPSGADGTRGRSFHRISRSAPLPTMALNLAESSESLAERLAVEALLPLFRRLHPEKSGWDLSLINVAVTNMVDAAGDSKAATGRDISKMFRQQNEVLLLGEPKGTGPGSPGHAPEDAAAPPDSEDGDGGDDDGEWDSASDAGGQDGAFVTCDICASRLPVFAVPAHQRFHDMGGD